MNKLFKKIFLITTFIALLLSAGYYVYIQRYPIGTGGINEESDPFDQLEGDVSNILRKQLPYMTDEFTISTYDYSKGKFVVELSEEVIPENHEEVIFYEWLQNSEFSPIPPNRFEIR